MSTLVLALTARALANPVAVETPFTMIGETVLVGVTDRGVVISGRYRFHVTPDASELWRHPPYPLHLSLPVPVPRGLVKDDMISTLQPSLTIKGLRIAPLGDFDYLRVPGMPKEVKVAAVNFWVEGVNLGDEFDVEIQYHQPVITVNDREMIYYVPFLPTFAEYEKQLRLSRESFVITFQSFGGTYLRRFGELTDVVRSEPQFISVRPNNLDPIAVERIIRDAAAPKKK